MYGHHEGNYVFFLSTCNIKLNQLINRDMGFILIYFFLPSYPNPPGRKPKKTIQNVIKIWKV